MAAYDGQIYVAPAKRDGAPACSANLGIGVALAGSGINPQPHYMLACFDTLGERHYWTDTSDSMTRAPALGGGATYTDTLVAKGPF